MVMGVVLGAASRWCDVEVDVLVPQTPSAAAASLSWRQSLAESAVLLLLQCLVV